MCFKTFGGVIKLDMLGFTTNFRIPTSKVNLSLPNLFGRAWLCRALLKPRVSKSQHSLIIARPGKESMSPITQGKSGGALPLPPPPTLPHAYCAEHPGSRSCLLHFLKRAGWRRQIQQTFLFSHVRITRPLS